MAFDGPLQLTKDSTTLAAANQPQAGTWLHELEQQPDKHVKVKQTVCDFASSLAAGVGGAVAFSLLNAETHGAARALTLPLMMAAGGAVKYTVKGGLEHALLCDQNRTLSKADLVWGGVDAMAGVAGSIVDEQASKAFLRTVGKDALGNSISSQAAEIAGRSMVKESVWTGIQHNTLRGLAGGAAGSLTWSLPHRVYDNWDLLKNDPVQGLKQVSESTLIDTAVGTMLGGALAGGATTAMRAGDITRKIASQVQGEGNLLKVNEFVLNDFHSNIDQLPRIKTRLDELVPQSQAHHTEFNIAGDALSGHVNFAFTKDGVVEYKALAQMGKATDEMLVIPGNHEYDAPGGRFVPERFGKVIGPVLKDNPHMTLLNANLDVSAYPDYKELVKPYVVREVMGPNGPTKVATIGLITEEGAVGSIKYEDAAQVAIKSIKELNAQGITNIKLLTHLGLEEDKKLARAILDNDLIVAKITGGHSHDFTPRPIWVGKQESWLDKLQFWKPKTEIPITQGGSGGRWLSDNTIAIRPDGSADRYFTRGKLHAITSDIQPDQALQRSIDEQAQEIKQLRSETYDATATSNYSIRNVRNRENALGNLIADSIDSGLRNRPGIPTPDIVMVHSGGIRSDIIANRPLSRLDLANVVMNAGKREGEVKELVAVQMNGQEIKDALEYGLRDFPKPTKPSLGSKLRSIFSDGTEKPVFDEPGNFVQVSGMKYTFDLRNEPFNRVTAMQHKLTNGSYEAIDPNSKQLYNVVTRFHPIDKWAKYGLFGKDVPLDQVYGTLNATPVKVSQVDLIGEYIRGKTIDPKTFSNVEGRVVNVTPSLNDSVVHPSLSMLGYSALDGLQPWLRDNKQEKH